MGQVFTEAEVRASLMFQLSKLCSLLLKAARLSTGGAEWDALVSGAIPRGLKLWQPATMGEIILLTTLPQCRRCCNLTHSLPIRAGWMCTDCIGAAGEVSGKLVEVDRIEAGVLQQGNEPVVLLVKQASGDEEVGTCGVNLRGVILCHGLPHLSHLGLPLGFLSLLKPPPIKIEVSP